ncbi:hypothetical protein HYW39_02195 [Candidatus Curtissbacteria bacterium]|nr:hypothetical protein [Candidatus Curtissbacteria bacterium]
MIKLILGITSLILISLAVLVTSKFQNKETTAPNFEFTPLVQDQEVDIKATFTIITNGITRNFNAKMYQNLSTDVYIEASNPTIVYVKKKGATWDDFFTTLPMTLTKDCLTTGTKETFCTGQGGTLRFYLNDNEDKDLLDGEIKDADKVLIQFSKN